MEISAVLAPIHVMSHTYLLDIASIDVFYNNDYCNLDWMDLTELQNTEILIAWGTKLTFERSFEGRKRIVCKESIYRRYLV